MILLHELPPEHELRNTPLGKLEVQCRNKTSQMWRDAKTWYIGRVTYNQLGPCWTECNEFRVPACQQQ